MAKWARTPASALGLGRTTNGSLLKVLRTDDRVLREIQRGFHAMMGELWAARMRRPEVVCLFEGRPLAGTRMTVVSEESATFEGFKAIRVDADHRNMVRFASAEEQGFRDLVGELERLVRMGIRPVRVDSAITAPIDV